MILSLIHLTFTVFYATKIILVIILIKLFINGIGSTSDVRIMRTGSRTIIHHKFWCIFYVNWRYMELFTLDANLLKLSSCFLEKNPDNFFFKLKQGNNFLLIFTHHFRQIFSSPDMVLRVSLPRCLGVLQNTLRIMRRLLFSAVLPHIHCQHCSTKHD